jgi:tetratricopeptide (TPR) repeat protein
VSDPRPAWTPPPRYTLAIFGLALAVRLLALATIERADLFSKYPEAAAMLRDGRLAGPRVLDFSPAYLELHRLALWAGLGPTVLLLAQCVAGATTCVLVLRITAALAGPIAGIVAGVLAAALRDLVLADLLLEPDSLLVLASVAAVWLAASPGPRRHPWVPLAAGGALLGLAIALRPVAWQLLAVVALAAAWRRRPRREVLAAAAAFVLALVAVQGAVALRNRGHGPGASMSPWQVLYLGNNPGSMGSLSYGFVVSDLAEQLYEAGAGPDPAHEAFRRIARASGAPSDAPDRTWRELALAFALEHPRRFLALLGEKVLALGQPYSLHDSFDARHLDEALAGWPLFPVAALLPIALAGFAVRGRRLLPVAAAAALAVATCLVFYASARYRLPLLPWLCVAAGALAGWVAEQRTAQLGAGRPPLARRLVPPVALAAGAALVFRLPLLPGAHLAEGRKLERELDRARRAASARAERGDLEEAVRELSRGLLASPWSLDRVRVPGVPFPLERMADDLVPEARREAAAAPDDPARWLRLGTLLRLARRGADALDALAQVERVSRLPDQRPLRANALVQRGLLRLAAGRTVEARAEFEGAAGLQPGLLSPLVGLAESSPPGERERILARAEHVNPRVAVLYAQGRLLLDLGRPGDALEPLSLLTAALPGWARGRLLHAVALGRTGRLDAAAEHAASAYRLQPSLLDARYSALEVWEPAAMRYGGDAPELWDVLARQAELLGEPETAARARAHLRMSGIR